MNNYIPVRLTQDESSHWYVIPESVYDEYSKSVCEIEDTESYTDKWYELINEFSDTYGKYRTGGSPNNYQLYVEDVWK